MSNMKTTKRALMSSVIALFLCFAMLLGTTYAWFTDSATSTGNKIQTGVLDVQLFKHVAGSAPVEITNESDPLFAGSILWEPGKTEVVYLSIKNNGNLALKYQVAIEAVADTAVNLLDVMSYKISPNATADAPFASWADTTGEAVSFEKDAVNNEYVGTHVATTDVELLPQGEHFFALSIHMDENAGNKYMNQSITFDIKVLAGQLAYEADSFGTDYDVNAAYGSAGFVTAPADGVASVNLQVRDEENLYKVAAFEIPAEAIADGVTQIGATVRESNYKGNFSVAAGLETLAFDVQVTGLKEGNTTPIKTELKIPAGLDPATVSVYHYDTLVADADYNPTTGYVTFYTTSYSPFTVVFDAESEYVAPDAPAGEYPSAIVAYAPDYVGEGKVQWGSYGQWTPTAGLEANLEAAFTFACPDAIPEAYRYWECDFYVSLDRPLGADEIFLGGYYAGYGAYVGFHNNTFTLPEANSEVALLGSVTKNAWTYNDVERDVKTFVCGVGDVENALEGATFTVKLRLTNPDENIAAGDIKYIDVNTVTYTFGGTYNIDNTPVVVYN